MNYFAHKFESRRSGTIIGLSSVAGDREEGRVILSMEVQKQLLLLI